MGMTVGLALLLFRSIWTSETWKNRTSTLGEPWVHRESTEEPPTVFFADDVADDVEQFVNAVRDAGSEQKGAKTAHESTFQGTKKGDKHTKARVAWKKFINNTTPLFGLRGTLDAAIKMTEFSIFERLDSKGDVSRYRIVTARALNNCPRYPRRRLRASSRCSGIRS